MSTSATPTLIKAIRDAALDGLDPAVQVFIGLSDAADFGPDVLFIGVEDPSTGLAAATSSSGQVPATLSALRTRDHSGTINCAARAWSGGFDQVDAMDRAYATMAAIETALRDDPSLGVTVYPFLVMQVTDEHLYLDTYTEGVSALLVFTVAFKARI